MFEEKKTTEDTLNNFRTLVAEARGEARAAEEAWTRDQGRSKEAQSAAGRAEKALAALQKQVGEATAELEALRAQCQLETRRAEEFRSAVMAAEGDRQLLEEQVASLGREAADAAAARERWANLDAAARAEAEAEVTKAKEDIIAMEVRLFHQPLFVC